MYPKYHETLEQGTEEWLEVRKGKITASHAQEIGNGKKGLETYIISLMAEKYSSGEREYFTNEHIERGNELEDQARSVYSFNKGVEVKQVGFVEYSELVGCSPDGLVGDDGMIEIKCPNDVNYFKYLLDGFDNIDTKYMWQMQMNLLITGRKWCDFIAYNPNFENSIVIERIVPNEEDFSDLIKGFEIGQQKIKEIEDKLSK